MALVINVLIYQIVWFLCVFAGNTGAFLSLFLLAFHLVRSANLREDLKMMFVLLLIGVVVDGAIRYAGLISYTVDGFPIPLWLAVIWLALAILPHHSLNWLKGRPLLSIVFAAVGGPLAYWAGVRFGSAEFNYPLLSSLALLAAVWALMWPLVMVVADRILPRERGGRAASKAGLALP